MDMRRVKPKPKPKILPLDKKVPRNPKYENVKSTIDTGNNQRKKEERMEEIRQYYKFRPDEIFRRITVTSLVTLMVEVSKLEYQEEDAQRLDNQIREDQESLQKADQGDNKIETNGAPIEENENGMDENIPKEEDQEKPLEEDSETLDGCEADSLDSAIDPEEHTAKPVEDDDDYIDSIVTKGKRIKKGSGLRSHHFSSVGNLLQGIGEMSISPRSINDMSDRKYHHHDSSKAASTFMLDQPMDDQPPQSNFYYVQDEQVMFGSENKVPKNPIFENENQQQASDIINAGESIPTKKKRDRPYLILDIRDVEDYKRGRLVTSKSYPFPRLCRSVNYETKDMLKFKNVEGKLIIVVDSDESMASRFATTLIQRGYDNVFILSGGLRVAKIKFPEQLIASPNYDIDDEDDFDEQIGEDQIHILEAFLEEALTSGTSRLSSVAPSARSGWPSRISSSQSNLPSLINSINGVDQPIRHKPRQVPLGVNYYPPRPQRTSFNSRRS